METIEIVACIDHRFTMPAGVMIHSVCKNNPDQEIRFHVVVDESVTEEDREDLRIVAGGNPILFYAVYSQAFSSMPLLPGLSHAAYYRLLMPQILSGDIPKVLYLDSDIIVRHSLLPLWETVIDGYALAAVIDNLDSVIESFNRLRYSPNLGYFNSGVLLINLEYWRNNDIHGEILSYMKNHSEDIRFCDQDILNYVLRDRKKPLPITYNLQTSFLYKVSQCGFDYWKYEEEILEARKDPVILHFTSEKPWMKGSDHPYRDTFLKYQSETKWKGCIWKTPTRPFWVKVRSRFKNILVELGLMKAASVAKKYKTYADGLLPID